MCETEWKRLKPHNRTDSHYNLRLSHLNPVIAEKPEPEALVLCICYTIHNDDKGRFFIAVQKNGRK